MISLPDWLVLTFAIIGIWTVASALLLIILLLAGGLLNWPFQARRHRRRQQRELVRDVETLLRKQDTP